MEDQRVAFYLSGRNKLQFYMLDIDMSSTFNIDVLMYANGYIRF